MKKGKWHRTVVVDDELWYRWQLACMIHKVKMSEAIRQLITEQLARWQAGDEGPAVAQDAGRRSEGMAEHITIGVLRALLTQYDPELPVYLWDDWNDFPLQALTEEEATTDVVPGDGLARPRRLVLQSTDSRV